MKALLKPVSPQFYRSVPRPISARTNRTRDAASALRLVGSPTPRLHESNRPGRELSNVHFLTAQELLTPSPTADAVSQYVEGKAAPEPKMRAGVSARLSPASTPDDMPEAHGRSNRPASRGLSRRLLGVARSYMESNLAENFTLDQLARTVGVSQFHFSRLFRASTGTSPMAYLLCLRIERAKQMLLQGDCKMCEIAIALGFFDQSHFSRRFRRATGLSPREYVRMYDIAEVAV